MNSEKQKSRISGIDLVRFLCALGILVHHFNFFFWYDEAHLGTEQRFRVGFIIVEIFLIMAGYFAAKHFKNRKKPTKDSLELRSKDSVKYTLKKFKGFMPYVILAIALGLLSAFITNGFSLDNLFAELEKLPVELTLNSGNINYFIQNLHVAPLWYLSLLFFVFPIFCTLAMSDKKYLRNWLMFIFVCVYYTNIFNGQFIAIDGMIRILAGLCLGQLLFDFVEFIKDKKITTTTRALLQVVELFCIYYIFNTVFARGDMIRPVVMHPYMFNFILASWVGLALLLSEKTYSYKINSRFISFLGQVAMPLYLVHVPVLFLVNNANSGAVLSLKQELAVSIAASLLVATSAYLIVESTKKKSLKK